MKTSYKAVVSGFIGALVYMVGVTISAWATEHFHIKNTSDTAVNIACGRYNRSDFCNKALQPGAAATVVVTHTAKVWSPGNFNVTLTGPNSKKFNVKLGEGQAVSGPGKDCVRSYKNQTITIACVNSK